MKDSESFRRSFTDQNVDNIDVLRVKAILPAVESLPSMIWAVTPAIRTSSNGREIMTESLMIGAETPVVGIDGETVSAAKLLKQDDILELHPNQKTGECVLRLVDLGDSY